MDLVFNNLQWLICHKTIPNPHFTYLHFVSSPINGLVTPVASDVSFELPYLSYSLMKNNMCYIIAEGFFYVIIFRWLYRIFWFSKA